MPTLAFINLPVTDLERSKRFFTDLGWELSPDFTDQNGACVVVSDTIFVMILRTEFFGTFTHKEVADASRTTETITALTTDSREEVDALVDRALAAGGVAYRETQDHGWMYERSFADPDGHQWEVIWMDPNGPDADELIPEEEASPT